MYLSILFWCALLLDCTLTACSEIFVFALQCEDYHLGSDGAEHPGGEVGF